MFRRAGEMCEANAYDFPPPGVGGTHRMVLCPIAPGLRALDCGYFLCEQKVTKESLRGRLRASFPPLRSGHDAFALPLRTPVRTRPPCLCFAIRFRVVSVLSPVIDTGPSERRCDRFVMAQLYPVIATGPEVNRRVLPLAPLSLSGARWKLLCGEGSAPNKAPLAKGLRP